MEEDGGEQLPTRRGLSKRRRASRDLARGSVWGFVKADWRCRSCPELEVLAQVRFNDLICGFDCANFKSKSQSNQRKARLETKMEERSCPEAWRRKPRGTGGCHTNSMVGGPKHEARKRCEDCLKIGLIDAARYGSVAKTHHFSFKMPTVARATKAA